MTWVVPTHEGLGWGSLSLKRSKFRLWSLVTGRELKVWPLLFLQKSPLHGFFVERSIHQIKTKSNVTSWIYSPPRITVTRKELHFLVGNPKQKALFVTIASWNIQVIAIFVLLPCQALDVWGPRSLSACEGLGFQCFNVECLHHWQKKNTHRMNSRYMELATSLKGFNTLQGLKLGCIFGRRHIQL